MNLQKFVFLGDNQQQTTIEQILVTPIEERTFEQSVIIAWYFRNVIGVNLKKEQADKMDFATYQTYLSKDAQ